MNEKVIAIIDKPSSCDWCPLRYYDDPWFRCSITELIIEDAIHKDIGKENCPLKPLPIRRGKITLTERSQDTDLIMWQLETNLHSEGWNDCLEQILGDTE